MIISYTFENFNSFKDEYTFSLEAPSTRVKSRYTDNYVHTNTGYDLLKSSLIMGENAGGKSNFIKSLAYLQDCFIANRPVRSYKNTINANLDPDSSQSFVLEMLIDDIIYIYLLRINSYGIMNEVLFKKKSKNSKEEMIFKVEGVVKTNSRNIEYSLGLNQKFFPDDSLIKSVFDNKNLNPLGLIITKLALLNQVDCVKVTDYIINDLIIDESIFGHFLDANFQKKEDDIDILNQAEFLELLQLIDLSIFKVEVDLENPFKESFIYRKLENGKEIKNRIDHDSGGVMEYFAWAVQLYKVIYQNKTVFSDEMDRVLNPLLSERIMSFIHGKDHTGQFVFTTHNAFHLNLDHYMKEQINFITKDRENLESELYSLADFPEIRYDSPKVYELYFKGLLGGTAYE